MHIMAANTSPIKAFTAVCIFSTKTTILRIAHSFQNRGKPAENAAGFLKNPAARTPAGPGAGIISS
jgi:hypothetical protein